MNIKKTQNLSFKRALKESEIAGYTKTLKEAREVLGANGKNVLIVPDTSLPTSNKSLIGNMSDECALEFAEFMKTYLGINAIEHLPQGDFQENSDKFNPYNATSLTYPKHLINLENFTKEEFGQLLKPEEIKTSKKAQGTGRSRVSFSEVYNENSDFNNTLKVAYARFDETSPLWNEYLEYRKENDENIIPRALFSELAKKYNNHEPSNWPEPDATLFKDVDREKKKRLRELKEEYKEQINFYAFQQFFASKNLKYSKEKLNKMGIELIGDCPIRFSRDEMWANPEACKDDLFVGHSGWDIKALDFENMFDEDGEPLPSMKLLGKKFSKMLKDYDGIRIDCGWCYVQPALFDKNGERKYINDKKNLLDDKVVKYFEKLAKEVKGEDFDTTKIMYEAEVGPYEDFFGFDENGGVIKPLEDRVQIFTTTYASDSWGTLGNYKSRGIKDDELIIGTGNHDSEPVNNLQKAGKPLTEKEIKELNELYTDYFKYRIDFKTKEDLIKAKRAEIALAKNQMHLFYDVFGWKLGKGENHHLVDNYYSTKINQNFKEEYLNSLKTGIGYNPMESLKVAFLKDGNHVHHKELYNRISKYSEILKAEEGEMLDAFEETKTEPKKKENKKSSYFVFGAIVAGLFAIGAFIHSKFKKNTNKKENI
ncbi:4-alpha-glucanotransferase [bacterium]|nr:4-alpha-glucanotransferase [bacterium]